MNLIRTTALGLILTLGFGMSHGATRDEASEASSTSASRLKSVEDQIGAIVKRKGPSAAKERDIFALLRNEQAFTFNSKPLNAMVLATGKPEDVLKVLGIKLRTPLATQLDEEGERLAEEALRLRKTAEEAARLEKEKAEKEKQARKSPHESEDEEEEEGSEGAAESEGEATEEIPAFLKQFAAKLEVTVDEEDPFGTAEAVIKAMTAEQRRLEDLNRQAEDRLAAASHDLTAANAARRELAAQLEEATETATRRVDYVKELEENLAKTLRVADEKVGELQDRLRAAGERETASQADITRLTAELEMVQKASTVKITELEANLVLAREAVQASQSQVARLAEDLKATQQTVADTQTQFDALRDAADKATALADELKVARQEHGKREAELLEQVGQARAAQRQAEQTVDEMSDENAALASQLREVRNLLEELNSERITAENFRAKVQAFFQAEEDEAQATERARLAQEEAARREAEAEAEKVRLAREAEETARKEREAQAARETAEKAERERVEAERLRVEAQRAKEEAERELAAKAKAEEAERARIAKEEAERELAAKAERERVEAERVKAEAAAKGAEKERPASEEEEEVADDASGTPEEEEVADDASGTPEDEATAAKSTPKKDGKGKKGKRGGKRK